MERDGRSGTGDQEATEQSAPYHTRSERSVEWERVERTAAFKELVRKRKAFIVPATIVSFALIMSWLVLGGLTTMLDGQAVGAMTWAYVYGFVLFVVALIILHLYMRQAKKWDRLAEEARREAFEGRTTA